MTNQHTKKTLEVNEINLPKGGGAIEGIGEKFEANNFTGSASLSLPIAVSPCRAIAPDLSISYSSGNGNGVFGLGFGLSVPSITRKTNKGIPQYTNEDIFTLSGSDDLVPVSNREVTIDDETYTIKEYQPRNEGNFSLIEKWTNNVDVSDTFWKVTSTDHSISIFGKTIQARIVDPSDSKKVFSWLLEETYDPTGDHQLLLYESDTESSVDAFAAQRTTSANRYIKSIVYGNKMPSANSILLSNSFEYDPSQWHFEVIFDYNQCDLSEIDADIYDLANKPTYLIRKDAFSNYLAGFEIRTNRLCSSILMFHRFKELNSNSPTLISASQIDYNLENQHAKIQSFKQHGYHWKSDNSANAIELEQHLETPPVELDYTKFNPEGHTFQKLIQEGEQGLTGMTDRNYQWVDLYGQGMPGILNVNNQGAWYSAPKDVSKNTNAHLCANPISAIEEVTIGFGEWQLVDDFPNILQIGEESSSSLTDVTGSGMLDVVVDTPSINGFWEMGHQKEWNQYNTFDFLPADRYAPQIEVVDMTGNGLSDRVQISEHQILIYPSLGTKGYGRGIVVERSSALVPEDFPNVISGSETESTQFANMSGGGLLDVVHIQNGNICYWPNLGHGSFDTSITMENAPNLGSQFNMNQLFLADIDGTGTQDVIYVTSNEVKVWMNNSGNSFEAPFTIDLPCPFSNIDQIQFADVTGRGTQAMVISYQVEGEGLAPLYCYYDFCNKTKPYLLHRTSNNMGAETEIKYASSIDYLLRYQKESDKLNFLPFPVQVVAEVLVKDHISKTEYSTSSSYYHGYYDGIEREFRGFGRVESQSNEVVQNTNEDNPAYSAPSKTIAWFHPGATADEWKLIKAAYEKEYFNEDSEAWQLPDTVFNYGEIDPNTLTEQQAHTALAGTPLRSELYGLDHSENNDVPYTVETSNHLVKMLKAPKGKQYGVFLILGRESLSYTYDRNEKDPQIQHSFSLKHDEYGHELLGAVVAYPRRNIEGAEVFPAQQKLHLTSSETDYFNETQIDSYLLGVPWQSKSFEINTDELSKNELLSFDAVKSCAETTENQTLLGHSKGVFAQVIKNEEDQLETKPLPEGTVKLPVLTYRDESLVFSEVQLQDAFGETITDYEAKLKEGFYVKDAENNWWNTGLTQEYFGAESYFMPSRILDPEGNATSYTYDSDLLYLKKVSNPLDQSVSVEDFDYQHLAPMRMVDINNNSSEARVDALGQVVYTSFLGTELDENDKVVTKGFASVLEMEIPSPKNIDEVIEDASEFLGTAQSYFFCDLFSWMNNKQPVSNISLAAQNYLKEGETTQDAATIQMAMSRSDGFGRLIEAKARVEVAQMPTAERKQFSDETYAWLTSGRTDYNNKGLPYKQWEPYYSDTVDYIADNDEVQKGVSATLFYDPIDRNYKTISAKGFLEVHTFTPWEDNAFDANNTLLESPYWKVNVVAKDETSPCYDNAFANDESQINRLSAIAVVCEGTYASAYLDNLGNTIVSRQRLRNNEDEEITFLDTLVEYDIQGRQLLSIDPRLGEMNVAQEKTGDERLTNFRFKYGYGDEAIYTDSADAGESYALSNTLGNPLFEQNAREIRTDFEYDILHRPIKVFVSSPYWEEKSVLDIYTEYGDSLEKEYAQNRNLLGQLYKEYAHAQVSTIEKIGLGGVLESKVELLEEYKDRISWAKDEDGELPKHLLMPPRSSSATYDAIGRVVSAKDVAGNVSTPQYWLSGQLKGMNITHFDQKDVSTDYLKECSYDAKGQRMKATFANGTETSYTYDPWTFAVTKIQTRKSGETGENDFLQNDHYEYDPVGNVITKTDATQDTVFFKNEVVDAVNKYTYNSIYQLKEATGRKEAGRTPTPNADDPTSGMFKQYQQKNNAQLEKYLETYTYDDGGNLTQIKHTAGEKTTVTNLVVSEMNNRAVNAKIKGGDTTIEPLDVDKFFDLCGNQMQTERLMQLKWNCSNNIGSIDFETGNKAYYLYDTSGQRTRKVFEEHTGEIVKITETLYFGSVEIHRKFEGEIIQESTPTVERVTQRISSDEVPFAVRNVWTIPPANKKRSGEPVLFYQLTDMQESVNILLNEKVEIISREEFAPYGQTSYSDESGETAELNTHKYCNKELDNSGFYYYGMRYYQAHLGRWLSTDPAGTIDGLNLYAFVGGNPATMVDVGGMSGKDKSKRGVRKSVNPKKKLAASYSIARHPKKTDRMKLLERYHKIADSLIKKEGSHSGARKVFKSKYFVGDIPKNPLHSSVIEETLSHYLRDQAPTSNWLKADKFKKIMDDSSTLMDVQNAIKGRTPTAYSYRTGTGTDGPHTVARGFGVRARITALTTNGNPPLATIKDWFSPYIDVDRNYLDNADVTKLYDKLQSNFKNAGDQKSALMYGQALSDIHPFSTNMRLTRSPHSQSAGGGEGASIRELEKLSRSASDTEISKIINGSKKGLIDKSWENKKLGAKLIADAKTFMSNVVNKHLEIMGFDNRNFTY